MGVEQSLGNQFVSTKSRRLLRIADPKYARNIALFNPSIKDIELLIDLASQDIPNTACPELVCKIFSHNPECFWALSKTSDDGYALDWPEGFFAILPLNESGTKALVSGELSTSNPKIEFICRQWEIPTSLYFWCIFAPGPLSAGVSLWANHYCSPKYEGCPIFAKAGTDSGARFFERLGFKQGGVWNGIRNDQLISLNPPARETPDRRASLLNSMPAYANYARDYGAEPFFNDISCSVAKSIDDLLQAMSIRSVIYIGDQHCPYNEEWDGNDLSASHIIARKGDDPVGTIRLRSFNNFAKVERLCVHPAHRKSQAAFKLERACSELARAMGHTRLIGHAQKDALRFWLSRGWKEIPNRQHFTFSDHLCIQIEKTIQPHADAITAQTDPLTLIRPVGRWHVPGPLDYSSKRPAANTN